jgi:hypothetical protein
MKMAEKQALALRDLAVQVVMEKGIVTASDSYSFHNERIRIEFSSGKPHTLTGATDDKQMSVPASLDVFKRGVVGSRDAKVLSVIWNDGDDGDAVIVLHHGGSWEVSLKRVAKTVIAAA